MPDTGVATGRGRRRGLRVAMVALAVLIVAAAGLALVDARLDQRPADDDAPTPAATAPAEVAEAQIAEILEQVTDLRGLEVPDDVAAEVVDPDTLGEVIMQAGLSELDADDLAADERLLAALRLAPPDVDLLEALEELYRGEIAGLYVPEDATMYARQRDHDDPGGLSPGERLTLAHEAVHAAQDGRYDLQAMLEAGGDDDGDARTAVLALVEGDAVLTEQRWAARHLDSSERAAARSERLAGAEGLADIPRYLQEVLAFPYRDGVAFTQALIDQGGQDAVDAALDDPPTATAQILHPQRYVDGVEPVEVAAPDAPAGDWQEARTVSFGEFDLRQLLAPLGDDVAALAGTGWAGGVVRSWDDGEALALGAVLAFDTASDADQACAALPRWYAAVADGRSATRQGVLEGDRDWFARRCGETTVAFGLGPDEQVAVQAAGGG